MMEVDLARRLEGCLADQAGRLGLSAQPLKAERVLNWGGFVAQSFKVGDGNRFVHVKLAAYQAEMRRWFAVHECLERSYRAPRVLDWVDVPGTSYAGLIFEHIDGETWDPITRPELVHDLKELLERLHADKELTARLGDGPRTYRDCWELRQREQFEQDLAIVRKSRPAFVDEARMTWMENEAEKVLALGAEYWAFDGVAHAPCHWDLWPANVLMDRSGAMWVLDWDGLAIGDEAEDFATLVWPFVFEQDSNWRDLLGGARDAEFEARMDLYLRAITLDYLIDALADCAECDVPKWREQVRARKEADHARYLDWYRNRWG